MGVSEKPYCALECDECGTTLGEEEEGYFVLVEREQIAETLSQYDWTQDGETLYCSACTDERKLQAAG